MCRPKEDRTLPPLPKFWAAIRLEQISLWPRESRLLAQNKEVPQRHPWRAFDVSLTHGIIIISRRTNSSPLPLLTRGLELAQLWLEHLHRDQLLYGGGHCALLARSRLEVWIFWGVTLARAVIRSYITCRKREPTPFAPREGPLPPFRFGAEQDQGVLTHILVDEFGPHLTRQACGRPAVKRWVLVVICGAVRAVHLELLVNKEATEVARAFVRFVCRRTVPCGAGAALALAPRLGGEEALHAWQKLDARVRSAWEAALASLVPELKRGIWLGTGAAPAEGDVVVVLDVPPAAGSTMSIGVGDRLYAG